MNDCSPSCRISEVMVYSLFYSFLLIYILLVLPLFIFYFYFLCFIVLCGNWTLGEPEGKVSFYACVMNNTIILNF